jgi:hypothetical protein
MAKRRARSNKPRPRATVAAPKVVAVEATPVELTEDEVTEAASSIETESETTVDESSESDVIELATEESSNADELVDDATVEEVLAAAAVRPEPTTRALPPQVEVSPLEDDDELLLQAADNQLDATEGYGIFKQQEGVVSWTITNLLDGDGKQYGKRELRANPPVLTLESSNGDKADFVLTKDFSGSLASVLERVHYGFYGLDKKPKKKFTKDTAKQAVFDAIGARPLQIGAFLVMALVVSVGLIAS